MHVFLAAYVSSDVEESSKTLDPSKFVKNSFPHNHMSMNACLTLGGPDLYYSPTLH